MVWAALSSCCDRGGICFPSLGWLAEQTTFSVDWVQRVIKELASLGEVKRRPRGRFYLPARAKLSGNDDGDPDDDPGETDDRPEEADERPDAHLYKQTTSSPSRPAPKAQPQDVPEMKEIAESFLPSEADIGFLLTHRPDLFERALTVTQRFIYWHRSRRVRRADWSAAWRAWILEQGVCKHGKPANHPGPGSESDSEREARRRSRDFKAQSMFGVGLCRGTSLGDTSPAPF
jgi:hypothetical protein